MKFLWTPIILWLALLVGRADGTDTKELDCSKFSILSQFPNGSAIEQSAFYQNQNRILRGSQDIPDPIVEREKAYTLRWNVVASDYRPHSTNLADELVPVRQIQNQDDGFFAFYGAVNGDWHVALIDGRRMEYLVQDKAFRTMDIVSIFKKAVNHPGTGNAVSVPVNVVVNLNVSHGLLEAPGWGCSIRPIEWYRDGNTVLFVFLKERGWSPSKMPKQDGSISYGGIPMSDKRPYLRFEKSNREELADEYLEKEMATWPRIDPNIVKSVAPRP